jgi:hypothetical protein
MENLKPIRDKQVAHKLTGLWYKLHTVHIHQHHNIQTENDKKLIIQIMDEVLELRDQIRTKIYLTELETENK